MKHALKTILLNQSIGAFVIAFLWLLSLYHLTQAVLRPLHLFIVKALHHTNLRGAAGESLFDSAAFVIDILSAIVNFALGYLIASWLYAAPELAGETTHTEV